VSIEDDDIEDNNSSRQSLDKQPEVFAEESQDLPSNESQTSEEEGSTESSTILVENSNPGVPAKSNIPRKLMTKSRFVFKEFRTWENSLKF